VTHNRIGRGGSVFPDGTGVLVHNAQGVVVAHNEIAYLSYTGVSLGWCWSYANQSAVGGHAVAGNWVHHLGTGQQRQLGDAMPVWGGCQACGGGAPGAAPRQLTFAEWQGGCGTDYASYVARAAAGGCGAGGARRGPPQDLGSVFADPLFADAQALNFSLLPGSPALALGFEPIDLSTVGPQGVPWPPLQPFASAGSSAQLLAAAGVAAPQPTVIVLSSTGGGFAAALAAARGGAAVTLLETAGNGGGSGAHIGGMVTGGLSHTDCGNASVIGGLTREYFERVERQYPNRSVDPGLQPNSGPPCWLFEPHVAERVMWDMLREANVTVVLGLEGVARAVVGPSGRMQQVEMLSGGTFAADVFIDGSYEGDLLAAGGATLTAGREGVAQYGEAGAGRRPISGYDQLSAHVSPYWPNSSETLPLIYTGSPGLPGEADTKLEAYAYRLCMTRSPSHSVSIAAPPPGYNASTYELFRRVFAAQPPRALGEAGIFCLGPLPNNYTDCPSPSASPGGLCKCDMISSGGLGTDFAQGSWGGDDGRGAYWPTASVAARRALALEHAHYTWGLLWFLLSDPAVPAAVAAELRGYGLCSDEWQDTQPQHYPHQLYVREARRLVGDFVLTQNQPAATLLNRSIGLGSYAYDAHTVQRVVHTEAGGGAWAVNEGEIMAQPPCYLPQPYRIPYDTLLPQRAQLVNVLAAVPVSASHVAFTSLRMEPTWMIMGHAAGAAAALAASAGCAVQDVSVAQLQALLVAQGQLIAE